MRPPVLPASPHKQVRKGLIPDVDAEQPVIPIPDDEAQYTFAVDANRRLRGALGPLGALIDDAWLR